jgi:hypothetical protein
VALEISEILSRLAVYTGKFPREAVEEAIARKNEITPHLLKVLVDLANAPDKSFDEESMLPLYAAYLLAQFRDTAAYRPLLKIAAFPERQVDAVFGDTITERLKNIFASVFDGSIEPLNELILNPAAYEFVRGAAIDTYCVLAHNGQISREQASRQFKNLFQRLEHEPSYAWDALASAVADLPAPELLEEVRKAYEEGLTDPGVASYEGLVKDASRPFELVARANAGRALVEDVVGEMSGWAAFESGPDKPTTSKDRGETVVPENFGRHVQASALEQRRITSLPTPAVRVLPKIGRNDLCPCGSGKKYKKCCLDKPATA